MHLAIVFTVAASWYLVGLSVTVGLVTYPSFARVGEVDWARFHDHHSVRISWAVGGAWAAQVLGLVWWLGRGNAGIAYWITALAAVAAIAITLLVAVPVHHQLSHARSASVLARLRRVHAVRTACWLVAAVAATSALL